MDPATIVDVHTALLVPVDLEQLHGGPKRILPHFVSDILRVGRALREPFWAL
jgi:hypothetical protein